MTLRFYMDVHVPQAITDGLRRRGVDVLTAIEDGCRGLPDDKLLERATELERAVFTQDFGFRKVTDAWQRQAKEFPGVFIGSQTPDQYANFINDLQLIAEASEPEEWHNLVVYLPL